mmetsp:Transcript_15171/g.32126  ORF Transcript_15171/g.32126 Transcript_15171/m.32126 type:complete len:340 (+) Transcript_15171:110-1129(+)|eukprot:CAMPEP_0183727406 /NCGR_PEP_ID=MMETSP0737-20130205/25657_1 /TAXON_ID=385413 /ORGANISM="Thalassiosira miniscula, Strain CCMP1093" /LENGTH=339 /DNA_ID=CAMNT_0025959043 /DNA_START=34 /DNA_END=1053 /DNA_ORIENTATION=-
MSEDSTPTSKTIVITGGLGNLGSKLCHHILSSQENNIHKYKVILLEHPNFINPDKPLPHNDATVLPIDLGNPTANDGKDAAKLKEALEGADALIHFSAVNPYPNATWSECAQSMGHTFYIFQMAVLCKVRRVILASSNHVMGGYKDISTHGPASVHPHSDPMVGTLPLNPQTLALSGDARAYAAAKLAGERLAMTLAELHGDTTSFVVLRIGWCQPGENLPATLTAAGSPPEFLLDGEEEGGGANGEEDNAKKQGEEDDKKDELWFKRMWLSNRDFLSYFDAALRLEVPTTEGDGEGPHRNVRRGFVLVNAMSKNKDAKWNLDQTEKWLGVVSTDDSLA